MKPARLGAFIVFALLSVSARAEIPVEQIDMFRCQRYDECMIVWGGCGDVAINKSYLGVFKPSPVCAQSTEHNPKALPTCTDGKCMAVAPSGDDKKGNNR